MYAKTKSRCRSRALQLLRRHPLSTTRCVTFQTVREAHLLRPRHRQVPRAAASWWWQSPSAEVGPKRWAQSDWPSWLVIPGQRGHARSRSSVRTADRDFSPAPQQALGRERPVRDGSSASGGRLGVEVTANHDRRIGMRKQLRTGQQVIGGGCQGVLIGTTVDLFTHQLLGGGSRPPSQRSYWSW